MLSATRHSFSPDLPDLGDARIRGLRRHEYELLVNAGLFEGQKLELLRGQLVEMSPQGLDHSTSIMLLNKLFIQALGDAYWVRPQLPWNANDDSVPEPDLAVVSTEHDFRASHPGQALLIVEVAASSLAIDRRFKRDLYAEAGVPEYWVVDVEGACVHIYRQPVDGAFTSISCAARGESITAAAVNGLTVAVDAILVSRDPSELSRIPG